MADDRASEIAPPLATPGTRHIVILANPAAGGHDPAALADLARRLEAAGARVETVIGRRPGDLARTVAGFAGTGGPDTVVVAGGDGTINGVVAALIARPVPRPVLAVMAQGTADVLAHEYALPRRAEAVAAAILAGLTRPLHLGVATDAIGQRRPFFLMVSAGLDAAVVHAVEARRPRRFKKLAFVTAALGLRRRRLPLVTATVRDVSGAVIRLKAPLAIVAKAAHYGGPWVLTRLTAADRPGLAFVALRRGGFWGLLVAALRLALGRLDGAVDVATAAAAHVRLSSISRMEELPVQIDGEPWGMTPVEVESMAETVELVVG